MLAAGAVLGVAGALPILTGGGDDPAPVTGDTAVATTTTLPVWVSPIELKIGPSVVVPASLEVSDGVLVFRYEVHDVVPMGDASREVISEIGPGAAAAPARWTLIDTDFEVAEEVVGPTNRAVRFPVPAGFEPTADTTIRLDAYFLAAPVAFPFEVDRTSAAWYDIGPGLQARVVETLEQAENSIVIVEVEGSQALTQWMVIDGEGREWVSSSRSMLGSHRWTLDYRGDELPDPLPLVVRGLEWVRVETDQAVDVEPILP